MPFLGNKLPGCLKRCSIGHCSLSILPGHLCLKDIFFIIAVDIYVSGIGVQNLLPSERREPDRFASLQTLSFLIPFARRFKNRRLLNMPIGTGLSDHSSDRST